MNLNNTLDLSTFDWKLASHRPFIWMLRPGINEPSSKGAEFTIPARVPGSNLTAMREARTIPDWNVGLQSRDCEWVEHRHWEFFTDLGPFDAGTTLTLEADGLDHSGWILVDNKTVAQFEGTLIRHRFDLSASLADGKAHRLAILFAEPPREQGQIGYSSRSRYFKPRYSYSWDWMPRIVPVGIWDSLRLVVGKIAGDVVRVRTMLLEDNEHGILTVTTNLPAPAMVRVTLGNRVYESQMGAGEHDFHIGRAKVTPWFPNGLGEAIVYPIAVEIDGQRRFESTTGFKRVRWLPCEGANPQAAPWICEVNGKRIFLQGVNWTPISPDYATVPHESYANLIELYKQMGCNLLRVWGGAYLEKAEFYELCDRAGLLVWQEFPLSSSGVDSAAPTDPKVIENLCTIATDYMRRRGHHACKLIWCGGNELAGEPALAGGELAKSGPPNDLSHPALQALAEVVEREDPGVRFLPTSPSGSSFAFKPENRGKGMHEDTHGPWNWDGDLKSWRDFWESNDSLFCSEFGFPSTSPLDILEKYKGDCELWPPTRENDYWMHASSWWILWDRYKSMLEGLQPSEGIAKLVELSQATQAEFLATAVKTLKDKFPRCGGVLIWMGHDCFPCLANTSVIDFHGRPKRAYHAIAKVFRV